MADISVPQGTFRTFDIPVTQGRGGEPYDLDNNTLRLVAKHRTSDPDADAVFVATVGDGLTVEDADGGDLLLTLEADVTADLAPHTALVYSLMTTDASARPFIIRQGRLFITPRVAVANP